LKKPKIKINDMKLFNFHTHTNFCDGSSDPEDYIKAAIDKGFISLGFSSHSPLPFENRFAILNSDRLLVYADTIRNLKEKYRDSLNVFLGLEIDFIPGVSQSFDFFKKTSGLEFIIGGVHLIKKVDQKDLWFTDGPMQETYDRGMRMLFGNDTRAAVTAYWRQVREMISTQKPDIVAHLDKIKMHNKNRFFTEDEKWYQDQLDETLDLIAETGTIVEVNTRGIYKGRSDELFPGVQALKKIHHKKIPVTLSSDAHHPDELSGHFEETIEMMKTIGFEELMAYNGKNWSPVKLD
jgi:histidinol-phosphatase (PHP family)